MSKVNLSFVCFICSNCFGPGNENIYNCLSKANHRFDDSKTIHLFSVDFSFSLSICPDIRHHNNYQKSVTDCKGRQI